MVKCLWRKKSDSWIHEKWITHLPERIKIAFETQEIHASNDGNIVEIGDTTLPTPQTQKPTAVILWVYLKKKDGKYICIRDMGLQTRHWPQIAKERHLVWSVFPYYIPNEFIFSSKSNGMTPIDRTDFLT
jgi:hypothetical protein